MLDELKEQVCRANRELAVSGLVTQTWGNVSGVDRDSARMVIKPSGVAFDEMTPEKMVAVDLETGRDDPGQLKPSSDSPTHLELYRAFDRIGGIVHTHSTYATAWAQAQRGIPVMGTTHADCFNGKIPCTRLLADGEIGRDYEANTGKVIVERFTKIDPMEIPGVLVAVHGPFAWGRSPAQAVNNAVLLEHMARLASQTIAIAGYPRRFPQALLDKHYRRKHGPDAYYGQD
jgi:L-ribulose-5-phosphate 4-epimerase